MTDQAQSDQQGSDEIDLAALDDTELVKQMHDDLYDGLADEIVEGTMILLDRGWSPDRTLNDALVEGMRIVGIDFRDGILFVPEVLLAANAMKAGMEILRPLLAETGAESIGKIVIGTVKGDIHDIGKNLVAMMLEGAGFEVVDLGINTDVDKFLAALELHKPDILGMSALLTTTMPYMKVVIDTLAEKGLRDTYIVLVGGAPLNEEFGAAIGADAYCRERGGRGRDRQGSRRRPSQDARRASRTVGGLTVTGSVADGGERPIDATPLDHQTTCHRLWRARLGTAGRAHRGWHRPGGRGPLPASPLAQPAGTDRAGAHRRARRRIRPPSPHRLRRLRHRRGARPLRR